MGDDYLAWVLRKTYMAKEQQMEEAKEIKCDCGAPPGVPHSDTCAIVARKGMVNPYAKTNRKTLEYIPMAEEAKGIHAMLDERGRRYGEFAGHALITQRIKQFMQDTPKWNSLNPAMQEALEMIAHKIGRILNGDPAYKDSWDDIAGYATLVADKLEG